MEEDHLLMLCKRLNVRTYWLRWGEGEMCPALMDPLATEAARLVRSMPSDKAATWLAFGRRLLEEDLVRPK